MRELVKMKEMAEDAAANVNHVKDEAQNFKLRAAIEKRELSHTVEGQVRPNSRPKRPPDHLPQAMSASCPVDSCTLSHDCSMARLCR